MAQPPDSWQDESQGQAGRGVWVDPFDFPGGLPLSPRTTQPIYIPTSLKKCIY